jgi:methionyl-tRNA formyltransferase
MLFERLAHLGADALIEALPRIAAGEEPVAQDPAGVTHAPKVSREDARVDWHQPAAVVDAQIRAMDPAPGAWSSRDGRDIKLFAGAIGDSRLAIRPTNHQSPITNRPGTIVENQGVVAVACLDGWLPLGDVTPAGGKRQSALAWYRGAQLPDGTAFE